MVAARPPICSRQSFIFWFTFAIIFFIKRRSVASTYARAYLECKQPSLYAFAERILDFLAKYKYWIDRD
jgi:hypothetical protein